eukprot:986116-Rhodomonas_salina.2
METAGGEQPPLVLVMCCHGCRGRWPSWRPACGSAGKLEGMQSVLRLSAVSDSREAEGADSARGKPDSGSDAHRARQC